MGFSPFKSTSLVGGWGKQVADGPEDVRAMSEFSSVSAASPEVVWAETMEI